MALFEYIDENTFPEITSTEGNPSYGLNQKWMTDDDWKNVTHKYNINNIRDTSETSDKLLDIDDLFETQKVYNRVSGSMFFGTDSPLSSKEEQNKDMKKKEQAPESKNKNFIETVWREKYSQGIYRMRDTANMLIDKIYSVELRYKNPVPKEDIIRLLYDFKYMIPGGSIIYGITSNKPVSLSNCFVISSPDDSYGGIFKADQEAAQIMKRRGGVGIDLSALRHKGRKVNNSAGSSTGVVSFAKRFSNTTLEVAQDGRRGALMLSLDSGHADTIDFIRAKQNENAINGANISLKYRSKDGLYFNKGKDPVLDEAASMMHKCAEPKYWDLVA